MAWHTCIHVFIVMPLFTLFQIRGPRLVQGVMASVGDLYLFFLSRRLAGHEVAQWTLLCQLLSWFTGYCCTRTLSNSMETVLVTAALFYFPWPGHLQYVYVFVCVSIYIYRERERDVQVCVCVFSLIYYMCLLYYCSFDFHVLM